MSTRKWAVPGGVRRAALAASGSCLARAAGGVLSGGKIDRNYAQMICNLQQQQQIIPRLQLLDDEDDGLTCRMCLQQFWYKSELLDHLKGTHSIADPDRYERDEKDKRTRKMRDDQQRFLQLSRGTRGGRNRGVTIMSRGVGTIRGRNIIQTRPPPLAGPRPSFQYRDGSFICDLCKKSFSDGNDMVRFKLKSLSKLASF